MKTKQRFIIVVLAGLTLYGGSYVADSLSGGYWMMPERNLHDQFDCGLSMHTAFNWQPRIGYHSQFVTDAMGYLYAPLIRLDRRFIHPTHYLSDKGGFDWCDNLPISEMHPRFREEARRARSKQTANQVPQVTARQLAEPEH